MGRYFQIAFWVITFIGLTLIFGPSYGGYAQSFYFVTSLFSVILGTTVFFNSLLVPKYLLQGHYFKFAQYSIYTLIFSVYFEILVITLALVVFANYQYNQLNPKTTDIIFLTTIMYLLVFANTIVVLLQEYFKSQNRNKELEAEQEKINKGYLVVKADRKNINLDFETVLYIESVGNYVRISLADGRSIMTKEATSIIEKKLPKRFLRIHRSIVINIDHITAFNREWVIINDLDLPISRKFKTAALERLSAL
ncbi:MAG: LytTR family transcriptional regulator [Bacteroidales bacterium]|nr:LytTR family transcriptional regulator [Bacteroidales bacterium]